MVGFAHRITGDGLLALPTAVNLPSLFTIARSTNWRVAAWLAFAVFALAVTGGVLVGFVK